MTERINLAVAEQGKYMRPACHAMDHDPVRMGTQISNSSLMVLYTDQELKRREMIIVDEFTGITVKVKLPTPTWGQLSESLELGLNYDSHRHVPYEKKVAEMGACPQCNKAELGYIGLKRVKYHWKDTPAEMHFGLCPNCDSVFFVDIKK